MKRGNLTQISMRTMLITWGVMEVLLPGVVAKGQSGTSFLVEAYQRQQRAESCIVYRSLRRRTESELVSNQSVLSLQDELLKKRREQLESCGTERGAVSFVSDDDEQRLAELCASQYAKWLHLGFQRSLVEAAGCQPRQSKTRQRRCG